MAASRLSLDGRLRPRELERVLRHIAASAHHFVRGYRYARALPAPAPPLARTRPDPTGPLESYFDAHIEGPGLFKWRHYFDIYERHLARFRDRPVNMVEIGVFGGGSMQMWRDYLGPQSHIYGIDIDPECKALEAEGIDVMIGDQADPAFWKQFLSAAPTIDIVLDDGGHAADQQAVTLEHLLPRLSPGGVYLCEDIHGSFHAFHSFVDGLTRPLSNIGLPDQDNPASVLHQHVASVHRYPLMTVIEKPAWSPLGFEAPRHGSDWPRWVSAEGEAGTDGPAAVSA
jgi:hypothetical protein